MKKAPSEILSLGGFVFLFVFTLRTPFIIVISYLAKTKGLIVNCIYLFYNFLCRSLTFYHCSYEEIRNEMKIKRTVRNYGSRRNKEEKSSAIFILAKFRVILLWLSNHVLYHHTYCESSYAILIITSNNLDTKSLTKIQTYDPLWLTLCQQSKQRWRQKNLFYEFLYFEPTLRPLIVGGLIKKRGLAIFPEEINGEGVNKWKWVDFVMQCWNKGGCQ